MLHAANGGGGAAGQVAVAVADLFAGMYATVGILAALRHAEATGCGQHVDIALLDAQAPLTPSPSPFPAASAPACPLVTGGD